MGTWPEDQSFASHVRPDAWDEVATEWDEAPATRAYAEAVFDSLSAVLADRGVTLASSRVCDFGCGTGLLTEKLVDTGVSVDAVDASSAMLEVVDAKAAAGGWSHVRLGRELPKELAGHDLVLCSSVCSFLDDYPATLRRLAALLRPGGLLIQWDWERDETEGDAGGLSRAEIGEALAAAGLVDIYVETAFEAKADGQIMRPLIGIGAKPY